MRKITLFVIGEKNCPSGRKQSEPVGDLSVKFWTRNEV
jgi:hypothetical protein